MVAAVQDEGRLHGVGDVLLGQPQLAGALHHADLVHPLAHGVQARLGDLALGLPGAVHAPHHAGKAREPLHPVGHDQPIVGQAHGGEGHAVRGVGHRPDGLAQHVDLPVGRLAARDERVERPGADPADVGARLVVCGVPHGDAAGVHQAAHEALGDVVAGVVVGPGEVLLADVAEGVVDAGAHLVVGHGEGELGVHDGEARDHVGAEHVADLEALPVAGDHGAGVHLRAGAAHGQHVAHGDDPAGRLLHAQVQVLPGVPLGPRGHRDALGVVDGGAAAHRQDQVDVVLARDPRALAQLVGGGVGHDAGDLEHGLAGGLERCDDPVIEAAPLDRPAAIGQEDLGAVPRELAGELVERVGPKVDAAGVVVGEVSEHGASFRRWTVRLSCRI